jgi:hypothetical protein
MTTMPSPTTAGSPASTRSQTPVTATATPSRGTSDNAAPGCFAISVNTEPRKPGALITAQALQDRLPKLDAPRSEPEAYVGTSLGVGTLGSAYLDAFQACTGADLGNMRFGWVDQGTKLGIEPMGVEVDGYTGWELAAVLIDDNAFDPDLRSKLGVREHAGWDYLSTEGLSVTASETTLYIMQTFCCVESTGDEANTPTYDEVVRDYLERINDAPARIPEEWR